MIATQIQEAMEENLGADDPKEWNWQALAAPGQHALGPEDDRSRSSSRSARTTWPST